MEKKVRIDMKDEKVWISFFQILVLIISTISISYFIHEADKNVFNVDEKVSENNSVSIFNLIKIFFKSLDITPELVSAQDTSSFSSGSSQSTTTQCCLKDNNGAICQEYSSSVIKDACPTNRIFPGKCDNTD